MNMQMVDKALCRLYRWSPMVYNYFGLMVQIIAFPLVLLIVVVMGLIDGALHIAARSGFYFDDLRRDFQRIRQGQQVYEPRCPDTD